MIRYEDLNLSALEATRHRLVRTVPKRPSNPYWKSYDVGQAIIERYSARMFLPEPVRRGLVDEALRPGPARPVELQHSGMAAIFRQRNREER